MLVSRDKDNGLGTPRMLVKSFVVPKAKGSKLGDLRIGRILSRSTWFLVLSSHCAEFFPLCPQNLF